MNAPAADKTPIQLWVEALRSGRFTQGQSYLCRDGEYCCLGVACRLYKEIRRMPDEDEFGGFFDQSDEELRSDVREWLGVATSDARLTEPIAGAYHLISLNDDANYTFAQIADVIESGKVRMRATE